MRNKNWILNTTPLTEEGQVRVYTLDEPIQDILTLEGIGVGVYGAPSQGDIGIEIRYSTTKEFSGDWLAPNILTLLDIDIDKLKPLYFQIRIECLSINTGGEVGLTNFEIDYESHADYNWFNGKDSKVVFDNMDFAGRTLEFEFLYTNETEEMQVLNMFFNNEILGVTLNSTIFGTAKLAVSTYISGGGGYIDNASTNNLEVDRFYKLTVDINSNLTINSATIDSVNQPTQSLNGSVGSNLLYNGQQTALGIRFNGALPYTGVIKSFEIQGFLARDINGWVDEIGSNDGEIQGVLSPYDVSLREHLFSIDSIFNDVAINSPLMVELKNNLYKKIEADNVILPKHIERTEDFEHFWKTTTEFVTIVFSLIKKLENLRNEKTILIEFLRQKGLFLCGNETLAELQELNDTFLKQMSYRGTEHVIPEIKRLLCNDDCDASIFENITSKDIQWTVGKTSPSFNGLYHIGEIDGIKVNETWSDSENLYDKDYFSAITTQTSFIAIQDVNAYGQIKMIAEFEGDDPNGIVFNPDINNNPELYVTLNKNTIYEVSIELKNDGDGINIEQFGVNAFDCDGNIIDMNQGTDAAFTPASVSNRFIDTTNGVGLRVSKLPNIDPNNAGYSRLSGFIYPNDFDITKQRPTSYNAGSSLLFPENYDTIKVSPYFHVSVRASDTIYSIGNISIKPATTQYSFGGMIGIDSVFLMYLENRNNDYSYFEVKEIIERYLINKGKTVYDLRIDSPSPVYPEL